jgi:signal transduction histidine kinase
MLDFGFGSLILNLIETDPGIIHHRVAWLKRWYGITLLVVVAAIGLGLTSLWQGIRQQILLTRQKDDFISAVSHELRTPLTAIRMYAEMLEKGWVKSQDKARHYYTSVRQESERLSRLIENVLDFSRIQRKKKQYHFQLGDINACVRQVVDMMSPFALQNGFTLCTEFVDLEAQSFDKDAITQIAVNLIDNAIKYAKDAKDKTICVRTGVKDQHVLLEVEDHGPGIPHAQRQKIFNPFYRTESESTRHTQGTGLGLALVKRFVEAHRGTIEILNAHPTGAIFRVTLDLGAGD